jgi:hypothetical protein
MCTDIMELQYVYLLQEREFIKTKENIYKVGKTKKENHTRFNQYPKGSVLLFQMICNNCSNIENKMVKAFKQKFILRKDIGNEYFEGSYKTMINTIYNIIKEEEENDDEDEDDDDEEKDEEEEIYQIKTYEEWIQHNKLANVIITNKKGEGYIRFKGGLWRKLYDINCVGYDEPTMEDLLAFIECNQPDLMQMIRPNNYLLKWDEKKTINDTYKHKTTNEIITHTEYYKLNQINRTQYDYLLNTTKYKFQIGRAHV